MQSITNVAWQCDPDAWAKKSSSLSPTHVSAGGQMAGPGRCHRPQKGSWRWNILELAMLRNRGRKIGLRCPTLISLIQMGRETANSWFVSAARATGAVRPQPPAVQTGSSGLSAPAVLGLGHTSWAIPTFGG